MTDKKPKGMTVSELLRKAGNGYEGANGTVMMNLIDLMGLSRKIRHSECLYALADKIDAELAQARGEALRQGAELWAKDNGWPDFREGEAFGQWLVRCAIKRPCFEDGEPVQWNDSCDIAWNPDGEWFLNAVKADGVPIAIGSEKVYAKAAMTDDGRVVRHAAPEVLGADGKPIKVGETVWNTFSGHKGVVKELNAKALKVNGKSTAYVEWSNGRWSPCIRLDHLTHTSPETQERIDEDALKSCVQYWGCNDISCGKCPALIDGKKPVEFYELDPIHDSCHEAQRLDLLRRQRELDKRKGGDA